MGRKKYIYTDKKSSLRAGMAVILGGISNLSIAAVIYFSFKGNGETRQSYGFVILFAACFALTGLGLGFVTAQNKDYYKTLPVLAILLNLAALAMISVIFYFSGAIG